MKRLFILVFAFILTASVSFAAEKKVVTSIPPAVEKKAAPATQAQMVDINSATEAELKAIPGIGDTYSKKIIAGRPYAKKDQLLSKKILPKAVYDKVKDLIVAKKVKMAK